jgi:hypothetical protein
MRVQKKLSAEKRLAMAPEGCSSSLESRRVRLTVIKVAEGRGTVQLQREAAAAFLPIRECWRAGYHIHGFYVVRSRTALKNFVD